MGGARFPFPQKGTRGIIVSLVTTERSLEFFYRCAYYNRCHSRYSDMNHPATTPPLRIPSRVRVVGAGGSRARGYTIQLSSEISLPNRFNFRSNFTGKERDEETGYGYFGARYMDHELMTMWLSVDPMADKYPAISPYAYCAWNPVKLVDPDGNDWYETSCGEIKWTDYHSQEQMRKNNLDGRYLGVTVEDGNAYYSLFNTTENLKTPEGRLVQAIDHEIVKYARCIRTGNDIENVDYGDFSNIYGFDRGMIAGMNVGGCNVHYGNELHYADADNVQMMVSEKNMQGRLESLTSSNRPLTGMGGGSPRIDGYRFNIVRKGGDSGNPIVTFAYSSKARADAFSNKVGAMCNQKIYLTLKQMRRVNGQFQQITQ